MKQSTHSKPGNNAN